jgi:PAS domain S-box-containing protein
VDDQTKTRKQLLEELTALRAHVLPLQRAGDELPPALAGRSGVPAPFWVAGVLETIADSLIVLDRRWRFVYLNSQAIRDARKPAHELLGSGLWELYPALLGTPLETQYRRAMAEQTPIHFEMRGLISGRWLDVHAYPFPDGLVAYSRDATERKRGEDALRESEERHRLIAELTSDYVYVVRFGPNGKSRLESVTEGFTRVTGYTLAELEKQGGWSALLHPDDHSAARGKVSHLLTTERHVDEIRLVTKGGETRWVRYSTQPLRDNNQGPVVGLLGAAQDITERKRAEAQLQEYARGLLGAQEKERRHVACELHDEVGQVLTGLRITLDVAKRSSPDRLPGVLDEAQRLIQELTGKVRDLSLRLRPSMLDDFGLVPALLWHAKHYTDQTQVQVSFEHRGVEARLPPEVETAAYRIVQEALTNVARHAAIGECSVRIWLNGSTLHLQVEDEGGGFDMAPAKGQEPSTGLSGMRERATLLGGRLTVESTPGRGTRLEAELPIGG